jgi:hypothetical protein
MTGPIRPITLRIPVAGILSVIAIFRQLQIQGAHSATTKEKGRPRGQPLDCGCRPYVPFTSEQWVEAVFHVPESLSHVSLQITVRARCLPWSSAS